VVRAFASQSEDLGSTIIESEQKTLKVGIHSFLAWRDSVENKPENSLVSLGKALDGMPLPLSG